MTKSRKLFSLIYNEEIHVSPGKKILSAEEYSQALSAEELINKMKEELAWKKDEDAKAAESAKKAAEEAGFKEGLDKWAEQMAQFEKTLQSLKAETEKSIIPVAIKAAEKIVGKQMAEKPEVFVDIVKQSLKAVAGHKRFTLYVNPKELTLFESSKPALRQVLEQAESLTIIPREDVTAGQCTIETEAGIINVNLEELWKALETAFQQLVKS